MSTNMGKLDDASIWLSKALTVNQQEAEATICLGDLYARSDKLEDAKKCYSKICNEVVCRPCAHARTHIYLPISNQ